MLYNNFGVYYLNFLNTVRYMYLLAFWYYVCYVFYPLYLFFKETVIYCFFFLQLKQLGHAVDKVEFIVMGGTFMSLPEDYRDYFIRNLHDALSGHRSSSVEEAVKYSERSNVKCIGITIETRPDYCLQRHLSDMLKYGCTRLEIGKF